MADVEKVKDPMTVDNGPPGLSGALDRVGQFLDTHDLVANKHSSAIFLPVVHLTLRHGRAGPNRTSVTHSLARAYWILSPCPKHSATAHYRTMGSENKAVNPRGPRKTVAAAEGEAAAASKKP